MFLFVYEFMVAIVMLKTGQRTSKCKPSVFDYWPRLSELCQKNLVNPVCFCKLCILEHIISMGQDDCRLAVRAYKTLVADCKQPVYWDCLKRNSVIYNNTRVSKLITINLQLSALIQLPSLILVTWVISSTVEISKLRCSNSTILESARGYNFVKKEYFSDRCKPIVV